MTSLNIRKCAKANGFSLSPHAHDFLQSLLKPVHKAFEKTRLDKQYDLTLKLAAGDSTLADEVSSDINYYRERLSSVEKIEGGIRKHVNAQIPYVNFIYENECLDVVLAHIFADTLLNYLIVMIMSLVQNVAHEHGRTVIYKGDILIAGARPRPIKGVTQGTGSVHNQLDGSILQKLLFDAGFMVYEPNSKDIDAIPFKLLQYRKEAKKRGVEGALSPLDQAKNPKFRSYSESEIWTCLNVVRRKKCKGYQYRDADSEKCAGRKPAKAKGTSKKGKKAAAPVVRPCRK